MNDDLKEIEDKIDKMLDEETLRCIRNYSDNVGFTQEKGSPCQGSCQTTWLTEG